MESSYQKIICEVQRYRHFILGNDESLKDYPLSLKDVGKVVIIASSSRSGSSLLYHMLKQLPGIYAPSGETVPFLKINNLLTDMSDSEIIHPLKTDELTYAHLSRDILQDCLIWNSEPIALHNIHIDNYVRNLALRFAVQWPCIGFDFSEFSCIALRVMEQHFAEYTYFQIEEFYLTLIQELRHVYPGINPYYYDINELKVRTFFPELLMLLNPPDSIIIEEPRFILIYPHKHISQTDLKEKTLLIKDPGNSYRMKFIKDLFPAAKMKVIHLTRNPAASINGLIDGWLHRGFYSANLKEYLEQDQSSPSRLRIQGYSDRYDWGQWWWNFDRPPSWEQYIESTLEEVCAFQWSANNNQLMTMSQYGLEICRVNFEDIIGNAQTRKNVFLKLLEFMQLDSQLITPLNLDNLPLIQSTAKPIGARWKKRESSILDVIKGPEIMETSHQLGYHYEKIGEW